MSWNSQGSLCRIEWSESKLALYHKVEVPPALAELIDRIRGYFYTGEPMGELPWDFLDQSEWTPFQRDVYLTISRIPHGETRTYGWVAKNIGNGSASRAVGQALRKNPLPILIPCHRVLASTSIGGFMGASDPSQPEMQLKRRLVQLEEEYLSPSFPFLGPSSSWTGCRQLGA